VAFAACGTVALASLLLFGKPLLGARGGVEGAIPAPVAGEA